MDDEARTGLDAPPTPELEVIVGDNVGQTFAVTGKIRLGRERDNDIVLLDPKVSRYHAQIAAEAGRWLVTDLGSSNHTYVNGEPIAVPTALRSGDRVRVGETEMTFTLPGQPADQTLPVKPVSYVAPAVPAGQVAPAGERQLKTPLEPPRDQPPAYRPAPPRLAWAAGGFVLLLCIAAVVVLYLVSRKPGQTTPTNVTGPTPAAGTVAATQPVSAATLPADLELVYQDDFSDSFGGWDDAFDAYTTKQYGNNRYQIEVRSANLMAWGLANRDVADFELEVEAKQEDGAKNNSYGLLFRLQDRNNFYRFDISSDGYYLLSKFVNSQWVTLADWTLSPHIKPDTNILTVSAFGPNITVSANGQPLASVTDSSFTHGNFGFFASTFSDPYMWASFDNLKLRVPKGQQITLLPTATPLPLSLASAPQPPTPTVTAVSTPTPVAATAVNTVAAPVSPLSTPTAAPTAALSKVEGPTSTPVPLPNYASRDQPLGRCEGKETGRLDFPVFDPARGTFDIYIANAADGSNRQLLQKDASQPALNKDGTQFAYRSWQADKRGLFARPLSGGDAWHFDSFFESARPQFSPADNSLMYHSRTGGKQPAIYRVIDGVGQVMRRDGFPIQGVNAKWAPNGRQFVYSSCLGSNCGVILSNIDGSSPVVLTNHPSDTSPEISPDGSTMAFMSKRGGDWEVYRVSITGGEVKALTEGDANDGLPTWSPDGKKIAFVSNRDGEWSVWDMNPDGSNQRRLFVLGGPFEGQVQHDTANSFGWTEENIDWIP